jgi:hypothetical protein
MHWNTWNSNPGEGKRDISLYTVHTVHFHLITHFSTNKIHTLYYTIQLLSITKLIRHVSVLQWNHRQGFKP